MAEDNIVSSNLGVMFGLDENINPLKATNLLSNSSEREDNQNTLFTNLHAVAIIQKLSEFKKLSSNVSNKRKSDQAEKNLLLEKSVSFQTSSNTVSSNTISSNHCVTGAVPVINGAYTYPALSLKADSLYQDDVGKGHHISTSAESQKTELYQEVSKQHTFVKNEETEHTLTSQNVIENLSEAGPDVAEFSEEELRSVAELFKEPSAFHFFHKASNSKLLRESPLGRLSLLVKLDLKYKSGIEGNQEKAHDSGLDISGDSNSLNAACGNDKEYEKPQSSVAMTTDSTAFSDDPILIDIDSYSMKKMDKTNASHQGSHCIQEHKLFTEEEFSKALKMQELLFHEKQLKRDKERCDQVKLLEREKQALKNQVVALSKGHRASRAVLEELLNIFTLWLTAKEQERVDMTSNNQKIMKERDQALEDLQNVETAFADLHRRYENCKSVLEGYKQNEERIKLQVTELQMKLKQQEQMYEMLRSRIQDKLDSANTEIESAKKSGDAEVTVLRAQLKKAEMKMSSLEKDIEQKNKENVELSSICDDLIAKVGKT